MTPVDGPPVRCYGTRAPFGKSYVWLRMVKCSTVQVDPCAICLVVVVGERRAPTSMGGVLDFLRNYRPWINTPSLGVDQV